MRKIILIAHNLRSCHNVGSLLRTAEGLGIEKVYLTGYTPYPIKKDDDRLPHIAKKLNEQIRKTALGAEGSAIWAQNNDVNETIQALKRDGYAITALEQTDDSMMMPDWTPADKTALIIGRETDGIEPEILSQSDLKVEIPMFGAKESFNVVQAAAMALYHATFI